MPEDEEMLETAQVIKELQISRQTLYNWIDKGFLHPVKKNLFLEKSPLLFPRSEIDEIKINNSKKQLENKKD